MADGTLNLNGFDQAIPELNNAGVVITNGAPGATLTVVGNYHGAGGALRINTTLGDDNSPADRLAATTTSGSTTLQVSNVGGSGAQTVEGIKVVDVFTPGSSIGLFTLQGDYVFNGQQAVVGGAYAYTLQKNGVSTPGDGDWYLRSSLVSPPSEPPPELPAGPIYQPGVPLYETYAQVLLGLTELPTLQQRVGDRHFGVAGGGGADLPTVEEQAIESLGYSGGRNLWTRIEGAPTATSRATRPAAPTTT